MDKTPFLYERPSHSPRQETYSKDFSGVSRWSKSEMYKGRFSYGRKKFQYSSGGGFRRPEPKELQIHRGGLRGFTGYRIKASGREGNFTLY